MKFDDSKGLIDERILDECYLKSNNEEVMDSKWEDQRDSLISYYEDYIKDIEKSGDKRASFGVKLTLNSLKGCEEFKLCNNIIFEHEYGLDNVLLIIPPCHDDWYRFDNIIDYCEEGKLHNSINRYEKIYPIYPYIGSYHDIRTGEKVDMHNIRVLNDEDTDDRQEFLEEVGCKDMAEYKENIRSVIPESVVALCKWANIFKDEADINKLEPMMYVYWG
jgi:hypothetical protein